MFCYGQIHAQNKARLGEATLDSEAITSPSEATLDRQIGSIHAQSEAGEAGEGIFRIKRRQQGNYPKPAIQRREICETLLPRIGRIFIE
jgi:hypothetical protein